METLDKRNETYGMDLKIVPGMTARAEILNSKGAGTGVSVQELINAFCEVLDGTADHDIESMIGMPADRFIEIRNQIKELWTLSDGTKVLG